MATVAEILGAIEITRKNCQKHAKNNSKTTLESFFAKNGSKKKKKKNYYSRNDKFPKIGKIGHYTKANGQLR